MSLEGISGLVSSTGYTVTCGLMFINKINLCLCEKTIRSQEPPRHDRAATVTGKRCSIAQLLLRKQCSQNFKAFHIQQARLFQLVSNKNPSSFPSWTPTYHSQGSATQDPVALFPFTPQGLCFGKGEVSQVQSRGEDYRVT